MSVAMVTSYVGAEEDQHHHQQRQQRRRLLPLNTDLILRQQQQPHQGGRLEPPLLSRHNRNTFVDGILRGSAESKPRDPFRLDGFQLALPATTDHVTATPPTMETRPVRRSVEEMADSMVVGSKLDSTPPPPRDATSEEKRRRGARSRHHRDDHGDQEEEEIEGICGINFNV